MRYAITEKRIQLKSYLIFIFIYLFASSSIIFGEELRIPSCEEVKEHFQGKFQSGMIIGLLVDGKEKIYSMGTKIKGKDDSIDQFTTFEIGSISKTFTATILADLELKKLVNANDEFFKYFPQKYQKTLEAKYKGITLYHLVTHTSGIPRMPSNLGDIIKDPTLLEKYGVSQLVEYLNECKLDFKPGTSHRYSNLGMSILGFVLAKSQNCSYENLVKKHIFIPLGMNRSSLFLSDVQRSNMALGYDQEGNNVPYWNATEIFQGSGFIKSCLFDMMIYLKTYLGLINNPLSKAAELASTPVAKGYPDTEICYAWYKEKIDEDLYITCHNGSTGGFY
jgi:CubicO group peptidase (beta-lactamase class C family)